MPIDFGIYGFFSDTIAQVFFPPSDGHEHENLIYSYLVFGGGKIFAHSTLCIGINPILTHYHHLTLLSIPNETDRWHSNWSHRRCPR